eukprot:g5050.t1
MGNDLCRDRDSLCNSSNAPSFRSNKGFIREKLVASNHRSVFATSCPITGQSVLEWKSIAGRALTRRDVIKPRNIVWLDDAIGVPERSLTMTEKAAVALFEKEWAVAVNMRKAKRREERAVAKAQRSKAREFLARSEEAEAAAIVDRRMKNEAAERQMLLDKLDQQCKDGLKSLKEKWVSKSVGVAGHGLIVQVRKLSGSFFHSSRKVTAAVLEWCKDVENNYSVEHAGVATETFFGPVKSKAFREALESEGLNGLIQATGLSDAEHEKVLNAFDRVENAFRNFVENVEKDMLYETNQRAATASERDIVERERREAERVSQMEMEEREAEELELEKEVLAVEMEQVEKEQRRKAVLSKVRHQKLESTNNDTKRSDGIDDISIMEASRSEEKEDVDDISDENEKEQSELVEESRELFNAEDSTALKPSKEADKHDNRTELNKFDTKEQKELDEKDKIGKRNSETVSETAERLDKHQAISNGGGEEQLSNGGGEEQQLDSVDGELYTKDEFNGGGEEQRTDSANGALYTKDEFEHEYRKDCQEDVQQHHEVGADAEHTVSAESEKSVVDGLKMKHQVRETINAALEESQELNDNVNIQVNSVKEEKRDQNAKDSLFIGEDEKEKKEESKEGDTLKSELELRIDATDGQAYSFAEFEEVYSQTAEWPTQWDTAEKYEQEELRIDETDGGAYTFAEFEEVYSETPEWPKQWEEAKPI